MTKKYNVQILLWDLMIQMYSYTLPQVKKKVFLEEDYHDTEISEFDN